MDHAKAANVNALILEVCAGLDRSIEEVMACGDDEVVTNYRHAVGRFIGTMLIDVLNPIYRQFPDLKPAALKPVELTEKESRTGVMPSNDGMRFDHRVHIDEERRTIVISRISGRGERFYTEVELPASGHDDDREAFDTFCRMLGENLLIDSPAARRLLGL